MKINAFNETKFEIDKRIISKIETLFNNLKLSDFSSERKNRISPLLRPNTTCNLILYDKRNITNLNKKLFKRKSPTDVISLNNPDYSHNKIFMGDIYICPQVVKENAKKFNTDNKEELIRIIIHGILHLSGFDHKKSFDQTNEKMFKIQEILVSKIINND